MDRLKKLLDALRYITIAAADKIMEFNNSWEDPWDSPKEKR